MTTVWTIENCSVDEGGTYGVAVTEQAAMEIYETQKEYQRASEKISYEYLVERAAEELAKGTWLDTGQPMTEAERNYWKIDVDRTFVEFLREEETIYDNCITWTYRGLQCIILRRWENVK